MTRLGMLLPVAREELPVLLGLLAVLGFALLG